MLKAFNFLQSYMKVQRQLFPIYELTPCQSQATCRMYRAHSRVGPNQKDRFICRCRSAAELLNYFHLVISTATAPLVNWVLPIFTNTVRK